MTYEIKTQALKLITEIIDEKCKSMRKSLADNNKRAQDAPSAMVSHSDTTKNQLQLLAVGLTERLQSLEDDYRKLKGHKIRKCIDDAIGNDSLIHVTDLNTNVESAFYVLPGGVGETVKVNGIEICVITPNSPLYRAIVRADFDDINFKKKSYSIDEVC